MDSKSGENIWNLFSFLLSLQFVRDTFTHHSNTPLLQTGDPPARWAESIAEDNWGEAPEF